MSSVVHFVGGPADGTEQTFPEDRPPIEYRVPVSAMTFADADPLTLLPLAASYRLQLGPMGQPARADDGSFRFEYCGQS